MKFQLTFAFDPSPRIEVLEYQNIILALTAHVVKSLRLVVLQIHSRACVVSSDVICLYKIS